MARQNTIADGMCALKNAADGGKASVIIEPAGKLLGAMFRIMQEAGYINGFEFIEDGRGGQFLVHLNGRINKCGAISPRYSVQLSELEYWETVPPWQDLRHTHPHDLPWSPDPRTGPPAGRGRRAAGLCILRRPWQPFEE